MFWYNKLFRVGYFKEEQKILPYFWKSQKWIILEFLN